MEKRYFVSKQEAVEFNTLEAKRRGCDMKLTNQWWFMDNDENGWYLIVDSDSVK